MAAGASGAVARAEPDEEPGDQQRTEAGVDAGERQAAEDAEGNRREEQAEQEGDAPTDVRAVRREQPAGDAANAGDAAGRKDEQRGGAADEEAAGKRGPRGEMRPVDHGAILAPLPTVVERLL